jgi:hypothetical protein
MFLPRTKADHTLLPDDAPSATAGSADGCSGPINMTSAFPPEAFYLFLFFRRVLRSYADVTADDLGLSS